MQKRFSRVSRRSIVVTVVGLAFAATAGIGLAQIAAGTSPTAAAAKDSTSTSPSTSTSTSSTSISTGSATTSTTGGERESEAQGNGQEKVLVCHMTGSGKSHTIHVAEPAVKAHVAHGDNEGACAETTKATAGTPRGVTRTHVKKSKPTHVTAHVPHSKPKHTAHAKQKTHGKPAGGNSSHRNGHGKK